jgi:hypothetical protein
MDRLLAKQGAIVLDQQIVPKVFPREEHPIRTTQAKKSFERAGAAFLYVLAIE